MGVNATNVTNKTVADAKIPFGCSVTTHADGAATATFNSAGTTPCVDSNVKVGGVKTDVGVSFGLKMEAGTGPVTFKESKKGFYCSQNHVAVIKEFDTQTSTDVAAMTAASKACEAFCATDATCNACSVDTQWNNDHKSWTRWYGEEIT